MIQQAAADSFKVPSYPWPLPSAVPQPTLLNALEQEISVHRIAKRISEMIEVGRQPGTETTANHWATVEAGLKLYLEFARAATFANASAVPSVSSIPSAPVPLLTIPPAPVPGLSASGRIVPLEESPARPAATLQKYRLGRHLESEDRLRNFMVYQRPISGRPERQRSQRRLPTASISSEKEESGAIKTGFPVADPIKGTQERTLFLLAKFGAAAVITLATATGFVLLLPLTPRQTAAASLRETGTSPTFTLTSPVTTAVASEPAGKGVAPATPPPAGWASHEAYQAWSPKFEVSIEKTTASGPVMDEFSLESGSF